MKNFDWTCFTRRVAVKSTMAQMYNAWASANEIEKWFLSKAIFKDSTGQKIDCFKNVEAGNTYDWNWYLYAETESGKITKANGKDLIEFTFAGNCLVEIKLSQLDEYIIVELTQKNIPTDDESKKGIRLGCDTGWSFYLVNLKSVYEGGLDLRNKEDKLKSMINS